MSPASRWRFALASALGSSHRRSGTPCQDASACEIVERADASFVLATVSDGAGSARHARIGARLACQVVGDELRAYLESGGALDSLGRDFVVATLERFRAVVQRVARRAAARPRDFACTLLCAVAGPRSAAFFQVGDGAIVIAPGRRRARDGFDWVFWPRRGEYANQTFFATDPEADAALDFELRRSAVQEIALLSDGLQGLVLDYENKIAHGRFFAPMFATVRRARAGHSADLSQALERYLGSPAVQRRTDDDTSLILISRRPVEPPPALPRPRGKKRPALEPHDEETR